MNKKEWQDLCDKLDTIHYDFYLAYPVYNNGSNKQKRGEGEKKVRHAINQAVAIIDQSPDIYQLLTNGNYFLYDEFLRPDYFNNDMPRLLSKIRDKIKSMD